MPKNIVWTSVISAVSCLASVIAAVTHTPNLVMSFGFIAITSALLSVREK